MSSAAYLLILLAGRLSVTHALSRLRASPVVAAPHEAPAERKHGAAPVEQKHAASEGTEQEISAPAPSPQERGAHLTLFCFGFSPRRDWLETGRDWDDALYHEVRQQWEKCDGHLFFTDMDAPGEDPEDYVRIVVPRYKTPRGDKYWLNHRNMAGLTPCWTYLLNHGIIDNYDWIINAELDHFLRPSKVRQYISTYMTHLRGGTKEEREAVDGDQSKWSSTYIYDKRRAGGVEAWSRGSLYSSKPNFGITENPLMLNFGNVALFNKRLVQILKEQWEIPGLSQNEGCPSWSTHCEQDIVYPAIMTKLKVPSFGPMGCGRTVKSGQGRPWPLPCWEMFQNPIGGYKELTTEPVQLAAIRHIAGEEEAGHAGKPFMITPAIVKELTHQGNQTKGAGEPEAAGKNHSEPPVHQGSQAKGAGEPENAGNHSEPFMRSPLYKKVQSSSHALEAEEGADKMAAAREAARGASRAHEEAMRRERHVHATKVAEVKKLNSKSCFNLRGECVPWAYLGECDKNPKYMLLACRKACGTCRDTVKEEALGRTSHAYEDAAGTRDNEAGAQIPLYKLTTLTSQTDTTLSSWTVTRPPRATTTTRTKTSQTDTTKTSMTTTDWRKAGPHVLPSVTPWKPPSPPRWTPAPMPAPPLAAPPLANPFAPPPPNPFAPLTSPMGQPYAPQSPWPPPPPPQGMPLPQYYPQYYPPPDPQPPPMPSTYMPQAMGPPQAMPPPPPPPNYPPPPHAVPGQPAQPQQVPVPPAAPPATTQPVPVANPYPPQYYPQTPPPPPAQMVPPPNPAGAGPICPFPSNAGTDCGFMGITPDGCRARGCCWDEHSPLNWCYRAGGQEKFAAPQQTTQRPAYPHSQNPYHTDTLLEGGRSPSEETNASAVPEAELQMESRTAEDVPQRVNASEAARPEVEPGAPKVPRAELPQHRTEEEAEHEELLSSGWQHFFPHKDIPVIHHVYHASVHREARLLLGL